MAVLLEIKYIYIYRLQLIEIIIILGIWIKIGIFLT